MVNMRQCIVSNRRGRRKITGTRLNKDMETLLLFFATLFIMHNISNSSNASTQSDIESMNFSQLLVVEKEGCGFLFLHFNNLNDQSASMKLNMATTNTDICTFDMYFNTLYYNEDFSSIKSTSKYYNEIFLPANYNTSLKSYGAHNYELAIDFINEKIYAISLNNDYESDKLIVTDFEGQHYGIILSHLNSPKHLVLDPEVGFLFIGQLSSIIRADMDGTNVKKIVEKNGISELTIDRRAKRIYWANLVTIESSDYNGNERRIVTPIPNFITSLTILRNNLIWLTPSGIKTYDISSTDTCGEHKDITLFEQAKRIKAYDLEEMLSMKEKKSHFPCKVHNGGCEHICLPNNISYSCACDIGYRLNLDKRTCSSASDEFLLYTEDNYFKGRTIDSSIVDNMTFIGVIYPNRFSAQNLSRNKIITFDYDFNNNYVFFADDATLNIKTLDPNSKQINLDKIRVTSISIDWLSKIIYCIVPNENYVIAYNYNPKNLGKYKIIYEDRNSILKLFNIVVHPNSGQVFFTMTRWDKPSIYKMNTDGSNVSKFLENVESFGLTIDHSKDMLYWFENEGTESYIVCTKIYNPSPSKRLYKIPIANPITINVYQEWMYISNLTSIWRLNRETGENAKLLIGSTTAGGRPMVAGPKIFSHKAQPLVDEHPCAIDNGGCETFCFAVPTANHKLLRRCGCEDTKQLQPDGTSCVF